MSGIGQRWQAEGEDAVGAGTQACTGWSGESPVDYSQVGSMVALALAAAAVVVSLARAEWPATPRADRPAVNADARAQQRVP